jgi:flagellar basal-body rod protein FlgB
MNIDDKTTQALAASLKYRQMRQELIASNIANAETPGYKAKKIDFEDALARALDTDGPTLNIFMLEAVVLIICSQKFMKNQMGS